MNGMIFAAGLGTRLRPLTNDRPKALVELKGKALLELVIERMREVQVERLVINIHHFADQVELFLKRKEISVWTLFCPMNEMSYWIREEGF